VTECVECGAEVDLADDVEVGEIVDCGTCGSGLEVVEVDPVVLELAPELEEDWGE
jgi:alpha-aminoadipate carrier protein LysW